MHNFCRQKNCATSCNFAITFDFDTLKNPTVLHLKDFCIINKFVFIKNVSFCMISMLKNGKSGELQNVVSYFCIFNSRHSKKLNKFIQLHWQMYVGYCRFFNDFKNVPWFVTENLFFGSTNINGTKVGLDKSLSNCIIHTYDCNWGFLNLKPAKLKFN